MCISKNKTILFFLRGLFLDEAQIYPRGLKQNKISWQQQQHDVRKRKEGSCAQDVWAAE
jgi:hypothetical protein